MRKSTKNLTVNQKTRNFLEDVLPTITNADLDGVEEWAELVLEEVEGKRAKYADAIERAEEGIGKAHIDQDNAETEEEFDAALDRLQRNEGKLRFNEHKLQEFDRTPRMNEETYDEKLELIHEIMEDGAAEFQRTASKAAAEIIAAREKYISLISRVDEVLEKLDRAANVLQSKYAYKTYDFVNAPSIRVEDPDEWRRHATRYGTGAGYALATNPDGKLAIFWRAAEKASK